MLASSTSTCAGRGVGVWCCRRACVRRGLLRLIEILTCAKTIIARWAVIVIVIPITIVVAITTAITTSIAVEVH